MRTNTLLKSALLLALPAMFIFSSCKKNKDDEAAPATSNSVSLKTQAMSGENEVPASGSTASGTFSGSYDQSSKVLSYTVVYTGVTPTSMHLHNGLPGIDGPVLITLTTPSSSPASGTATLTQGQEDLLMAGKMYINIHSSAYAAGDIRAQVITENMVIFSNLELTGDNEVPSSMSTATAMFNGVYNKSTKKLSYAVIDYSGAAATAMHIHTGDVGTTGAVVFTLTTPATSPTTGITAAFTDAQEADLLAGKYYVNIHTSANANGEVRAQLTTSNFIVFQTTLNGTNEAPTPVVTLATGTFYGMYNDDTNVMTYTIVSSGFNSTVTSAHIHDGAAGTAGSVLYTLTTPTTSPVTGTVTFSNANETKLKADGTYVNIHTTDNANGEVRGQIIL